MKTVSATIKAKITVARPDTALQWGARLCWPGVPRWPGGLNRVPTFPPDDHTHTEWSWDARSGSMEGSCARAVELGLPSIAFT